MKSTIIVIFISVVALFGLIFANDSDCNCDEPQGRPHNCRMWSILSNNVPDSIIYRHLIAYPYSLERLSESSNIDGWGIAYYQSFGDSAIIERGAIRAHLDPEFDAAVEYLETVEPNIILSHVRNCSAGCCAHGRDSIPDPHPFIRYKDNRYWTFMHNGTADKALLYQLIGEQYLADNPLTGSFIPECDPADSDLVIDSELYFLLLLKNIELDNWNVADGIIDALTQINTLSYDEALNFVLSDGYSMWTYRKARSLYYYTGPMGAYHVVASRYPTNQQGDWNTVYDHQFLIFESFADPVTIDLCDYLPKITGVITDPEGEPVYFALALTIDAPFSDRSNSNGEYELDCMSLGTYDLRFYHNYYADTVITGVEITPENLYPVQDLVMRYPGRLTGMIVNQDLEPVLDVRVSVRGTNKRTFSDSSGMFSIDSLNLGDFDIDFTHPYYDDTTVADIGIFSDSTTLLNMAIGWPGYINGLASDTSGRPIENAFIALGGTPVTLFTNADGTFAIDSLNSASYDLSFYHINYPETLLTEIETVSGDTTDVNLVMPFLGYAYYPGDANMFYSGWPPNRIGMDVTYIVSYLRMVEICQPCSLDGFWASADANGDCQIIGSDVTRLVAYFRELENIEYCPDYPPQWFTVDDFPENPPLGWPPCDNNYPAVVLKHIKIKPSE